jgi:hypothetical protein
MNLEHATPELFAALAKSQGEVENATKGSVNPHFKSKYADLAEVLNTIRPVFATNGLSIIQIPSFDGAMASVTTCLAHAKGGMITGVSSCVPAKTDAQGIGAATTYLRRYSLASVCGVAQEDDDGQSAAHVKTKVQISPLQVAALQVRLEILQVDEEAFCKFLGVEKMSDITIDKMAVATKSLDAKQKKMESAK